MLLAQSLKAKRSASEEEIQKMNCYRFNNGNGLEQAFYSPGYPENYTKNVTCIHKIEGKFKLHIDILEQRSLTLEEWNRILVV